MFFNITFANDEQWSLGLFDQRDSFGDLKIAGQAHWRRRTTGWEPVVTQPQELKLDKTCLNDLSVKLGSCFILVKVTVDLRMFWEKGGKPESLKETQTYVKLHKDIWALYQTGDTLKVAR